MSWLWLELNANSWFQLDLKWWGWGLNAALIWGSSFRIGSRGFTVLVDFWAVLPNDGMSKGCECFKGPSLGTFAISRGGSDVVGLTGDNGDTKVWPYLLCLKFVWIVPLNECSSSIVLSN